MFCYHSMPVQTLTDKGPKNAVGVAIMVSRGQTTSFI